MRHPMYAMITLSLSMVFSPALAFSQECTPPSNESCAGAKEFGFSDLPLAFSGLLGCTNDLIDRPYFDVFFRYDCTVAGPYEFDMCGSTGDTYMRIYTGGCGFLSSSSQIEDDDGCTTPPNSLDPHIILDLDAGTSYWIELGAWRPAPQFPPNANDPYNFNVSFLGAAPVPALDRWHWIAMGALLVIAGRRMLQRNPEFGQN